MNIASSAVADSYADLVIGTIEEAEEMYAKNEVEDFSAEEIIEFEEEGIDIGEPVEISVDLNKPSYFVDVWILRPTANVEILDSEGEAVAIEVSLTDATFSEGCSVADFSFDNAEETITVADISLIDEKAMKLTVNSQNPGATFEDLEEAILVISAKGNNSGREIYSHIHSFDTDMIANITSIEETSDGIYATIDVHVTNGELESVSVEDINLEGDLEDLASLELTGEDSLQIVAKVDEDSIGTNQIPPVEGEGDETLDQEQIAQNVVIEADISIDGNWGNTDWGEGADEVTASLDIGAQEIILPTEHTEEIVSNFAVSTKDIYGMMKEGLKYVAKQVPYGDVGFSVLDALVTKSLSGTDEVSLKKVYSYLTSMDGVWSKSLTHQSELIQSSNYSRILDAFDSIASKLSSATLHNQQKKEIYDETLFALSEAGVELEEKKTSLESAENGSAEYDSALLAYQTAQEKFEGAQEANDSAKKAFTASINETGVHLMLHEYGEKLFSGSSGLSGGAVDAYDSLLGLIYNFDIQTYDLKENFRVEAAALYWQAYEQVHLYYSISDSGNYNAQRIRSQFIEISNQLLSADYDIVRRTDGKVYSYTVKSDMRIDLSADTTTPRSLIAAGASARDFSLTQIQSMMDRSIARNVTFKDDIGFVGEYYRVSGYESKTTLLMEVNTNKSYSKSLLSKNWSELISANIIINTSSHAVDNQTRGLVYTKDLLAYENSQQSLKVNFKWSDTKILHTYNMDNNNYFIITRN